LFKLKTVQNLNFFEKNKKGKRKRKIENRLEKTKEKNNQ
jgi:hypothetical protein